MKHTGWDYEDTTPGYYHIYPVSYKSNELMGLTTITLDIPQTDINDELISGVVERLDKLAESL